ncbi:hypothetical protein T484DRAFT_1802887 [Baffinella frigidus]|nr:hypothetical protein T484DRAFT_1802887 [Cryptophyta sp. CCMP2293]
MAPYSPPAHTAATRKQSHLNVIIDGIPKKTTPRALTAQTMIPARRPSLPTLTRTSGFRTQARSTEMSEDILGQPVFVSKLEDNALHFEDGGCSDWRSATRIPDDTISSSDAETVWHKAAACERTDENGQLLGVLEDTAVAGVGSPEVSWSPWESELLQFKFWEYGMLSDHAAV